MLRVTVVAVGLLVIAVQGTAAPITSANLLVNPDGSGGGFTGWTSTVLQGTATDFTAVIGTISNVQAGGTAMLSNPNGANPWFSTSGRLTPGSQTVQVEMAQLVDIRSFPDILAISGGGDAFADVVPPPTGGVSQSSMFVVDWIAADGSTVLGGETLAAGMGLALQGSVSPPPVGTAFLHLPRTWCDGHAQVIQRVLARCESCSWRTHSPSTCSRSATVGETW